MLLYCFRGIVGEDLTPEMMVRLGGIAARHFRNEGQHEISVAGDYRIHTAGLKHALMGGLASAGMSVTDLGVLCSGAIAAWCKHTARPGCMVTASHNPPEWNGVQFMESDRTSGGPELEDAARLLDRPMMARLGPVRPISRRDDVLDRISSGLRRWPIRAAVSRWW